MLKEWRMSDDPSIENHPLVKEDLQQTMQKYGQWNPMGALIMDFSEDTPSEKESSKKSVKIIKSKRVSKNVTKEELMNAFRDRELGFNRVKTLAVKN